MIIGVVGKIVVGKMIVVKFFEEKGFCRVFCSDLLIDLFIYNVFDYFWILELFKKVELICDRFIEFGKYLKDKYGGDIFICLVVDKKRYCKNIVIDGVCLWEEVEMIKCFGGKVIYVEVRLEIRYERLRKRRVEKDRVI